MRWIMGNRNTVAGRCPFRINIMGSKTRNSSKELIKMERALLRTNICLGMNTIVTKLGLPTIEKRDEFVPMEKNRHATRPTRRFAAKFSSCLKKFRKTNHRTIANKKGLRIDQKNPRLVFWYLFFSSAMVKFLISSLYCHILPS
jgi:hypothetical protein